MCVCVKERERERERERENFIKFIDSAIQGKGDGQGARDGNGGLV